MNGAGPQSPGCGRGQRVLVTGGSGFVGSTLVRLLGGHGYTVRSLDLDVSPQPVAGVTYLTGSILDRATLNGAISGVDWVFHLAANPNLWARDPRTFMETNLEGTCRVLEAAARAGVARVIHTSTESIIKAPRGAQGPFDETLRCDLEDMPGPYCRSKFLAEAEAVAAAKRGQDVVIVNPTLPVGPGDSKMTPPTRMLRDFLNARHPAYLEFQMNMVDVRDLAEGHLRAALHGRSGERYILGGHNISMSGLLALLSSLTGASMPRRHIPYGLALLVAHLAEGRARVTGRPPEATVTGVRLAGAPMIFDSAKAASELGFRTRPLRASLVDAIGWLVAEGVIRRCVTLRDEANATRHIKETGQSAGGVSPS